MKGYHYLMRLGHMINVLAQYSEHLVKTIRELGMRGFIRFVRETIGGRWLDPLLDEAATRQKNISNFHFILVGAASQPRKIVAKCHSHSIWKRTRAHNEKY
jgi:hypothetical protein